MDVVQVLINALLVSAVGILLAAMTHGLRRDVRQDISEFRAEVRAELQDVRAELREVRSDLTRVALAVGAERRAGNR